MSHTASDFVSYQPPDTLSTEHHSVIHTQGTKQYCTRVAIFRSWFIRKHAPAWKWSHGPQCRAGWSVITHGPQFRAVRTISIAHGCHLCGSSTVCGYGVFRKIFAPVVQDKGLKFWTKIDEGSTDDSRPWTAHLTLLLLPLSTKSLNMTKEREHHTIQPNPKLPRKTRQCQTGAFAGGPLTRLPHSDPKPGSFAKTGKRKHREEPLMEAYLALSQKLESLSGSRKMSSSMTSVKFYAVMEACLLAFSSRQGLHVNGSWLCARMRVSSIQTEVPILLEDWWHLRQARGNTRSTQGGESLRTSIKNVVRAHLRTVYAANPDIVPTVSWASRTLRNAQYYRPEKSGSYPSLQTRFREQRW